MYRHQRIDMLWYYIAGGGPETITILNVFPGRYRYRVSEYIKGGGGDNVERLKKSEARVSVYTSTGMKQFEVGKEGSGFVKVGIVSSSASIFAMA